MNRDQKLIIFYLENNSLQECGDKFGFSRERARQILNANGIKPRFRTLPVKPFRPKKVLTSIERFWSLVDKSGGEDSCWEWQGGRMPTGYGRMRFGGINTYTHQLAFYLSNKHRAKNHVLHSCDNPPCCNPKHLYDGTHQENMRDRNTRGREKWLQATWSKKNLVFSEAKIIDIKQRLLNGEKGIAIAEDYGVRGDYISLIKHGKVWADVQVPDAEQRVET